MAQQQLISFELGGQVLGVEGGEPEQLHERVLGKHGVCGWEEKRTTGRAAGA